MYKYITEENSSFYDLALDLSENNITEVFCDIETTGLDPRKSAITLFQIMVGEKIYIFDFTKLKQQHLQYIVNLLDRHPSKKVFFNTKFDIKHIYDKTGIMFNNVFDVMNCEVLLNAGIGKSLYSLEEVALKYCNVQLDKNVREEFFMSNDVTEKMLDYAAMDVKILRDIYTIQIKLISDVNEDAVLDIEMKLLPVVSRMEYDGVLLDKEALTTITNNEESRLISLETEIREKMVSEIKHFNNALEMAHALKIPVKTKREKEALESILDYKISIDWAKSRLNLNSYIQLPAILNLIGIPVKSADKKELKKFKEHDIIGLLLERSESQKRISTYGKSLIDQIHDLTCRVHTEFINMGAATGRFSSTNPNLQNIPTAKGYRESFVSSKGWKWLSLDYSQQEFRLAGGVSGEPKIIEAYLNGVDMHTATASILYNKPLSEITKEERNRGKTVNFAILYGSSEYGLKYNLGISLEESLSIINSFNTGYSRLHAFKSAAEDMVLKLGFSSTPLGRRRYNSPKPLYMNSNEYIKYIAKVKREGFNHIIQGGGADIIKIAMVNIYNNNPFGDKFRMLIQVHDEINAEAHESIANDVVEFMKAEMLKAEQPFLGEIPAAVDFKMGDCWIH